MQPASINWSAHISMLFTEYPFAERPGRAWEAGFDTIEMWWPPDDEIDGTVTAVQRHGLSVASLNAYSGDLSKGMRGTLNVPDRNDESIHHFSRAVELSLRLDASRINVLIGTDTETASRGTQLDNAAAVLTMCVDLAAASGIIILIEAINDVDIPGYLVPSVASAVDLIERVGSDRVRLLYDAYHAARRGVDPIVEIGSYISYVDHVQFAEHPGRGAPGTGDIGLARFVAALGRLGYTGAVGLEYQPAGPTAQSLLQAPDVIPPLPRPRDTTG